MPEYSIKDVFDDVAAIALPTFSSDEKLAALSADEVREINNRLLQIAENEEIFHALWEARMGSGEYLGIYDAVRLVKKWTKTDFRGINAEGDDLDVHLIMPWDVVKSGTALSTWKQTVTAGTTYFWSDTGDGKVNLGEDEAIVIVGWYDPVDSPKASAVMIELPKRNIKVELPFDMNKDMPLIIHPPVVVKPKESFRVKVKYSADGDDALRPIGVKISKADNFNFIS